MGDQSGNTNSGASGSMLSLLAGAALGAAGLGWWLLAEAEQRRQGKRQARRQGPIPPPQPAALEAPPDRELHDRVHELNQAIEDVRRQLETMNTRG
ncbi:hypothetical protein KBZ15_00610 [Cyanobium sp. BA20m-p-22]|uniref:hypothetical protein n=1 Tax=Cyanobium sp. BA20m-p-22 TaxID=2823704 RepID=UPI0020CF30C4|nr:hypothetical protein [Cyanobium sp. BA20m-p-22]MCP9908417.1 hypothetical protein [Cyanobium sp. BA20m-p-22]